MDPQLECCCASETLKSLSVLELRNVGARLDAEERRIRAKQEEVANLISQKESEEQAARAPNPKGLRQLGAATR